MRKIWFTNREGTRVEYLVADDVADALEDLWQLVNGYSFFEGENRKILWFPPYLYMLMCNIDIAITRFRHFIHRTFFPKNYAEVHKMFTRIAEEN